MVDSFSIGSVILHQSQAIVLVFWVICPSISVHDDSNSGSISSVIRSSISILYFSAMRYNPIIS